MKNFARSFCGAFSVILLLLLLVFSFEIINKIALKSGFSSGNVLSAEFSDEIFCIEILGEKLFADSSFAKELFIKLKPLEYFLPPFIRLGIFAFELIL